MVLHRSGQPVDSIAVVIPVHNEQERLSACLQSVRRAAHLVAVPVHTVVVLDSCTDRSAEMIPSSIARILIEARNVGAARAAGFDFAAQQAAVGEGMWYATTDADSVVPPRWLAAQLSHAATADMTVGTVVVDWRERSPAVRAAYEARYRRGMRGGRHLHVHGANLGFHASRYHRIGGFAAKGVDEDVDLVDRFRAAGARIAWLDSPAVLTSDRSGNRVRGGFAGYLSELEAAPSDCA
ncbi:glycosyltransferase [Nocardia sp. NBC_01327]|uniref:glycosyltransferase n=1 Tax=Nocardia sp. NBC_01327 TaxID=2903593 RepID=UPI002E15606A|nr:glycosyltransferase [Nocardia sp. NBC_01327]